MKKKVLSLFMALLILFGAIPLNLLAAAAESYDSGENNDSSDGRPVISIVSIHEHVTTNPNEKNYASPREDLGEAYFRIRTFDKLTEPVTVHYATEDKSAIASAGDYEATSGSVVLTPDNPEVIVSVKTPKTEYAIDVHVHNGHRYYSYLSLTFVIKITGIEGNAVIDENNKEVVCALLAEHHLVAYQYDGLMVMSPYTHNENYKYSYILKSDPCDKGETWSKKYTVNLPVSWKNDYADSGIDAKLYMTIQDAHIDESWNNDTASAVINVGPVLFDLNGEFYNTQYGIGLNYLYRLYGISGSDDQFKDYCEGSHYHTVWKTIDNESCNIGYSGSTVLNSMESNLAKKYVIRRRLDYFGEPAKNSQNPGEFFMGLSDEMLSQKELEIKLYSSGGYDRVLTGGSVLFRLEDVIAPQIKKNSDGSYVIYHNLDTAKKGEKLRVYIRFNEPVQITGKSPYMVGKVNGLGTGTEPNPYAIRFNYVGGSGTDTLCFESDYQGEYQITSITDIQFKNVDSIKDFGGVSNSFSPPANLTISGFNLDNRKPVISVAAEDAKMNGGEWARSKSISVTVSNISDSATLYYSWIDSDKAPEKAPEKYENQMALNNISVNGTQKVNVIGGGDGTKYLCLKVVSKYGQEKRNINLVGSSSNVVNSIGPYYFDNSAPTIDEAGLLPKIVGANINTKKYVYPTPTDNGGSGFAKLEMYYIDENGEACRIDDKTYTGGTSTEIILDAAEVGIGNNTKREVTIFFTLTDALGNVDDDVARHTVLFDTYTYIDIDSAGPSSTFQGDTEYIDNGYSMIYSGNIGSKLDEYGHCYSFDIKVSEQYLVENLYTRVLVNKNGADLENAEDLFIDGIDTSNSLVTIRVGFKAMGSGYYDIYLATFEDEAAIQNGGEPIHVSRTYRIYVGSGKGSLDEAVDNGTVLINKVYQLPSYSYFYYMDKSGTIGNVASEAYNGTALSATFSSESKAFEYVLFHEYRDLYAVKLTAELADALNEGRAGVQKAKDEETVAREGQIWIRYKSASWDVAKTPKESDWVFYYYGSTEKLSVSNFSKLLTDSIRSIAERITNKGKTVALTDFSIYNGSGAKYLDKTGAPYLNPLQIHTETKRLVDVPCNSEFVTDIVYTADSSIYSSSVIINNVEYILVGNVIIPSRSRFQYKRIDENGTEDKNWTDVEFSAGQRFRDVLKSSARYRLRELGSNGVSEFKIYLDGTAPMLLVSWIDQDGSTHSQILNQSSEKEFRARSLRVVGIDSREYDKYSYVAFYNMTDTSLYGVYTLSELQRVPVDIPDGNYYMIIADRSGNSYTIMVNINSSNLNCKLDESENIKITFKCDNRKESQIQEFYVKRDGILVSGKYAQELVFTESGTYEFYVRDIYGNVFSETHEFIRVYPEVTWKYRNESGHYVAYDPQNKTKYFNLERYSDGKFTISTSVDLLFQIPSEYKYTFVGNAPEYSSTPLGDTVSIKTAQPFQLKVYYNKHPEVYTIYNCYADTLAPIVDASIEVNTPLPNEIEELRQAIASGEIVNDGSKLIPSKISYSSADVQIKHLKNNDIVLSDFIKVDVSDESGLASVRVYLNGNLVIEQLGENTASGIILSKAGAYQIVAEDLLGNKSEFNFTNGAPNAFSYLVDGLPYKTGLNDFEKFDANGNYTDCVYGNEAVSFVISEQMKVFYMISDSVGAKHFVAFDVRDGAIYEVYYCMDSDNNLILATASTPLFDVNNPKTAKNVEQVVYEIKDMGVKIYGKVNNNGEISLTIYANDKRALTVEARLNTDYKECYYTKTEISSAFAALAIRTPEGIMDIAKTDELIKLNRPFAIVENRFEEDKIDYASVYYSSVNDFDDDVFYTNEDIYAKDKFFEKEGFYLIILVNKYGNESRFVIHVSYKFNVTSYTEYSDGLKVHYSADYKETLYSNNKIVFEVYANGVNINVKKDGKDYKPVVNIQNGITYVILSDVGSYTVTFLDAYRNTIERKAEINTSSIGFNENLLTGYNENALKKNEGYTNQKLSVNKDVLKEMKISYLALQHGENLDVIYDTLSEKAIALDEGKLVNLIGNSGDGEYVLIVRNRYGLMLSKVIHYRATPTLTLEREIRTSTDPEPYDINKALSIGFWSNSELIFKTDAEHYVFTVNGDKTECPKTIAFESAEQQGRSEFDITYVDEYGFSYTFKAYLVRQDIEVKPDLSKDGVDIDGMLTTSENISILFSEGASCTYTLNNSAEKVYKFGDKLSKDGVYRFVVTDYAGNMATLTIKKDTIAEFSFVESNSTTEIPSGGVVNNSKVEFHVLNKDSAYIEKVYKNGVAQTDFNGTKFADDGKWEVIVSDKLGNKSYFCFYIVTKQKAKFTYTTPYEYRITELWYDSGDGVKISYLKFVDHSDFSSSFEFSENGKYEVVMTSSVTGSVSKFEFKINTNAPKVSLVGCNPGETTIHDVTLSGCSVGDIIKIYRATNTGEKLVKEIAVTASTTKMPTINEGGEYRIVVESEAGVTTELSFVRKHIMNTAGSIFIMIVISVAVIGLFVGLIYRNKSKTDK